MTKENALPTTKKQFAEYYGIDVRTLNNWIKPHINLIGEQKGRLYTPEQARIIKNLFG